MKPENPSGSCDLVPGDRLVEKSLPDVHVGREEVRTQGPEEIERKISQDKEDDDHRHRSDNGAGRILRQG